MVIQARRSAKRDGLGFTLLELLLTVALLLALLSAVVFNFSALRAGAELDEGARQFSALVRFAAAHAANHGRTVQLRFGDDPSGSTNEVDEIFEMDSRLRLVWEPDPILQPGAFVDVREAEPMLAELAERVRVDRVRTETPLLNQSTNEVVAAETQAFTMPAISFFPDGSSDTADIVLVAKNAEDMRRVTIHLSGVTGQLRVETERVGEFEPVEWMDDDQTKPAATETTQANSISTAPTTTTTTPATTTTSSMTDFSEPEETVRETTKTNDFSQFDVP